MRAVICCIHQHMWLFISWVGLLQCGVHTEVCGYSFLGLVCCNVLFLNFLLTVFFTGSIFSNIYIYIYNLCIVLISRMHSCLHFLSYGNSIHLPSKTAAARISHTTQKLQKVVQLGIQRGQEGRALGKTFVPEALCLGFFLWRWLKINR